jgi:hypothetical protein
VSAVKIAKAAPSAGTSGEAMDCTWSCSPGRHQRANGQPGDDRDQQRERQPAHDERAHRQ